MRTVILLFFIAASAATFRADGGTAKPAVVETNVCDLVKRSNHFDNANVRVRAIVMCDLIEHTMLVDNECPARGISLWIPHELDDSEGVQTQQSGLRAQWTPGRLTTDTQMRGVFTGVFLHERKQRFLKVSQVGHVEVAPPMH